VAIAVPTFGRVVIVEDEVTLRSIIARNLTRRGVLVAEMGTADEAVRAVEAYRPDLLLLDVNLPDRSGWDVLRDLRRQGIEVPTVVISAVRANPARLAEFRPLAYLPKPFPLEALLRLVIGPSDGQRLEDADG
jgi:DNA-binding response OmpR family regulator